MAAASAKTHAKLARVNFLLAIALAVNFAFWCGSRDVYVRWSGVPPVPSRYGAVTMTLGDPEFSYRALAIMLQNLGDVGNDVTPLKDYNYAELGKWLNLMTSLDPVSNHIPMIAAYYFGGTRVPKDVGVIVNYLEKAGTIPLPEKWRWLGHAVYLAQHRMYNYDLALKLAYELQRLPNSDTFPQWARQMPAFVLEKRGDKDAARELMEQMMLTQKNLLPQEINTMKAFLVEQLGVPQEEVDRLIRMRGGN